MYFENANVALWFDKWNLELLSGTAHLQRGGRNPTEGAENRARSLPEARAICWNSKKNLFFIVLFGKLLDFLYLCTRKLNAGV